MDSKLQLKVQKSYMLTVQTFTFNPVQENTYIVYNEKGECCIIDPGCYFANEEMELKNFISNNRLKPLFLLNTHCHLDHIFGNRFVSKTYNLPLYINQLEKPVLEYGPISGQLWQLPFDNYDGELKYLNENDNISLSDDTLKVLFTPGHSPGSISFYSFDDKFIISGDVLFEGSVGRTDLPGADFKTLEQTIRSNLYSLPPEVIVYPGHGGTTKIAQEMKSNPFVRMN